MSFRFRAQPRKDPFFGFYLVEHGNAELAQALAVFLKSVLPLVAFEAVGEVLANSRPVLLALVFMLAELVED